MTRPAFEIPLALIGCGAAARHYYVPALKTLPQICKRLHLVDPSLPRAQQLAAELGAASYGADHRLILDKVRGVIIATPHFLHYAIALDCLRRGIHVLCEKPVAESLAQVQAMTHTAADQGVTLSVNNTWRLFPSFQHVRSLIARGDLGRLRSLAISHTQKFLWDSATDFYINPLLSDKGVTLDLGAHVLDLVCWLVDRTPDLIRYQDDSFGGPESVASLAAKAGTCDINVTLNRLIDGQASYVIVGEAATVECSPDDWTRLTLLSSRGRARSLALHTTVTTYPQFVQQLVYNFINVIVGAAQPLVPADRVAPSIGLIEECYKTRAPLEMPWYDHLQALLQ